jgi:Mg2+-importing ATPase
MSNIAKFMLYIGPISSIFDYMTFGVLIWFFDGLHNQAMFNTAWFVESCLSQTLVVHVIRTTKMPILKSNASPLLYMTTFAICAIAVWLPYSPLSSSFDMVALPTALLNCIFGIVAFYLVLTQLVKSWIVKKIDWI